MKTTIYDVAKEANVSISTVSKVLNNTGNISEKTKNRIWKVIEELQYQPSVVTSARKMMKTIGLLIPDIANPFMAELARAVEDSGRKKDFSVIICSTDNHSLREEEYITMLKQKHVDGIIVATGLKNSQAIRELIESDMPVVMLSRDIPHLPVDTVVADDFKGGYEAAVHLAHLGHANIAVIAEKINNTSIKNRVIGFKEGLQVSGIQIDESAILDCPYDLSASKDISLKLLNQKHRPTAVFVTTELLALGVLQAARQLHISIPSSLSLVGFDNSILAKISDPQLTTIAQPTEEMGEKAIELLMDGMADSKQKKVIQRVMLSPSLIVRNSTASLL
ncbi:LacI family transcriptional regulator [Bacillus halotolerans]|uniref:LacI family DNA-binding transcriptional regulator n=1 Tax=Bacillus TaxID=1386 RepID=UPI000CD894A3|nr:MULTISPECIES: LacI family DNA-binding transcriptional regulator [Bacillus]MCV0026441.1 LacI family transcriptional regulator [Bacillus sp. XT-2]MCY8475226.1 LacI family transcriptional regulator [Bacillus halotolerans]PON00854.1 LacI family transcriptional regulator [Bacillus halotolerans]QPZ41430.1 LacI family DNA-binding transcriptional regulator [Bacillus halotolerans]WIG47553.1 LacI family DNA-binding transcriptional regulator [Bacillus halotolerans]